MGDQAVLAGGELPMLDECRIMMTRPVAPSPPDPPRKAMARLLLKCVVQGRSASIYVDFREPVEMADFPRMVVECPEGFFDSIDAEVWDVDDRNLADSAEIVIAEDDDEDQEDEDQEDE